jgi:hypothetical protein
MLQSVAHYSKVVLNPVTAQEMIFSAKGAELYNSASKGSVGGSEFLMATMGSLEPENKRTDKKEPPKKPYTKPTFRFERVFETQALSCGKVASHGTSCKLNPKAS